MALDRTGVVRQPRLALRGSQPELPLEVKNMSQSEMAAHGGPGSREAQPRAALPSAAPNPRRVAAGKVNRSRRGPLSAAGLERLRAAALRDRPWRHATGPKTAAGKARVTENGKKRQIGPQSVRELRAELAEIGAWLRDLGAFRDQLTG
jgi:hypothetical protein